ASPVAIMAVNENGELTLWNPACETIFGWTAEEVIGKWLPFVAADKRRESEILIERVKSNFESIQFEDTRYRKDRRPVTVLTTLMPLFDENGKFDGVMGTMADLTEERAAQKALESQRAAAVQNARLAALGEMASGIAHEINNPLAIIAAHSNTMLTRLESGGSIEKEKFLLSLKKIETVSFRIAKIIKGLRNFARHSEGEPAEVKYVDSVVSDTLEICRERFRNSGIHLHVNIAPNLLIKCQSVQISQVLLNLLNNAFDASVDTANPWVAIEAKETRGRIEISIVDSGSGIPLAIIDRIAEPFFTTKPVGQGTGLGLSISKGIVELHDGTLVLDRSSKHTRFIVSLPAFVEGILLTDNV
ncbi:MAG TPA: ATP-binding protein, partial [Bdellovibrionales bacterium]|nr:ATP-binding protein [Bdellovibrionales bacterium]